MKKEFFFLIGLFATVVGYSQTANPNTPQLQLSGTTEQHKTDTVSPTKPGPVAIDAARNPASVPNDKPKNENKTPMLTNAEPK